MIGVYVLQLGNGKGYYGSTGNIHNRFEEHKKGGVVSTKGKGPYKVIGFKEFENISDAIKYEIYIKKTKNKSYISKIMNINLDGINICPEI